MANIQADERLQHIAFIMDGNGRWAKKRGMPREYGHTVGAKTFERVVRYCGDIGIRVVTVYAFSTENWRRPQNEVQAIMGIFGEYLDRARKKADENRIHTVFLGDKSIFPEDVRQKMEALEQDTAHHPLTLNIAINYGGRDEIVHAVNTLIAQGRTEITEDDISANLCGSVRMRSSISAIRSGPIWTRKPSIWRWKHFTQENAGSAEYDKGRYITVC